MTEENRPQPALDLDERDEAVDLDQDWIHPPDPANLPAVAARERPTQRVSLAHIQDELSIQIQIADTVRQACLKALNPSDFVIHGDGDDAPCYMQNTGSQKCKPFVGWRMPEGPPKVTRVPLADGHFEYEVEGLARSNTLSFEDFVIGGRSSQDPFFRQSDPDGNPLPISDLLVKKSAITNWENRGVSGLAGLRGWTVRDFVEAGHGWIKKAKRVTYQKGAKGGGFTDRSPKNYPKEHPDWWDKTWSDLPDEALKFYAESCKRNLKDASKKQYHENEKSRLSKIVAVIKERKG